MNEKPETTGPEISSGRRFTLVDALRGIAALAVLFHHLLYNSILQATLWQVLPGWFAEFCHSGAFGVEIFFVLSGFVITHSLRNVPLSPKSVGNFMLRRQLRLDPPYWTVMVLTIISIYVEMHVPWIERRPMPNWVDFGANLFYLQNIVGRLPILGVAWTLCLEVQFYIIFILLLVAGKLMSRSGPKAGTYSAALVALLGVVSMLLPRHSHNIWFTEYWYYFAAGSFCYWAVGNPRFRTAFIGYLILFLVAAMCRDPKPMLIGWATTVLLYTAGRMETLTRWLDFAPLQYLGRISYSLYLSHLLVAIYVLRLGYRLTGTNHAAALLWYVLAAAVSIMGAHILYLLVERSSVRFAARFKQGREEGPRAAPEGPRTPLPSNDVESLQNA
jgi:peptidoglycan/LPS O-acetylase OafA/YrhL